MKHYPATMTRTLDIIERRRVYNIHMANLYPAHGLVNNSPMEPCQGITHKQEIRKYYREMEFKFRDEQLQRIQKIKRQQQRSKSTRRSPRNYRRTLEMINTNDLFRPDSKVEDENNDQNNSQNPDLEEQTDDLSETSDQILERLGLESGMRVLDRSLSPRYSFNLKKKANIILPDSSLNKTQKSQTNMYYMNVHTQTLKRPKKYRPHPPDDDNLSRTAESSPRRSRTSSRISESGMKDDDFEDSEKDNEENEQEDNDSNKEQEENKEENEQDDNDSNKEQDEKQSDAELNNNEQERHASEDEEKIPETQEEEIPDQKEDIQDQNKTDEPIEPEQTYEPPQEPHTNENENNEEQTKQITNNEEKPEIQEPISQIDDKPKENEIVEKQNEVQPPKNEDSDSLSFSESAGEEERRKIDEEDGFSTALRDEESDYKREEEIERRSDRETEKRIIEAKRKKKLEESYLRSQQEGEDLMNRGLYDDSDLARDLSDARKMESDLAKEESDAQKLDSDAQIIAENLNI